MRYGTFLLVGVLVAATGCRTATKFSNTFKATDARAQLDELIAKESKKHSFFGHLAPGVTAAAQLENMSDADAKPVRDAIDDHLAMTKNLRLPALSFSRLADGQVCFLKQLGIGTAAERQKEAATLGETWVFVARSHASLDELDATWPAKLPSTTKYLAEERAVEVCTPAPAMTAETRFLTVTALHAESDANNYLLVWDFAGTRRQ